MYMYAMSVDQNHAELGAPEFENNSMSANTQTLKTVVGNTKKP